MEPRFVLQNAPEHLCFTCKYIKKCRRFRGIHQALQAIEEDALEKMKLDLEVTYTIKECDMYSINWDLVNAIAEAAYGDDEEEGADE